MRRVYPKPKPFDLRRPSPSPMFARRCGSGEYEVYRDGVKQASGFDTFAEAQEWIDERQTNV